MPPQKRQPPKKRRTKKISFPPIPGRQRMSLNHTVRSQVSGSTYNVFNFDALEMQTLQPMYRDQMLALYRKYVVRGVTIVDKIVNKSTTVDAEVLTYHGSGATVASLTFSQALEFKTTRRYLLSTSGNKKVLNLSRTVMFNRLLPKDYWSDSEFWGTALSKPPYCISQDSIQCATGFYSADGTSSISIALDRRIVFHVEFFELAAIANSLNQPASEIPLLSFEIPEQTSSSDDEIIPNKKPPEKTHPKRFTKVGDKTKN